MDKDTNKQSQSDKKKNRKEKKIISSSKRDPNKSLEYWTEDKMKNAKPIPLPIKEPKEG